MKQLQRKIETVALKQELVKSKMRMVRGKGADDYDKVAIGKKLAALFEKLELYFERFNKTFLNKNKTLTYPDYQEYLTLFRKARDGWSPITHPELWNKDKTQFIGDPNICKPLIVQMMNAPFDLIEKDKIYVEAGDTQFSYVETCFQFYQQFAEIYFAMGQETSSISFSVIKLFDKIIDSDRKQKVLQEYRDILKNYPMRGFK